MPGDLALNIGNMALRHSAWEHRDEVPEKYSRPRQGKPPYWSIEGPFVMNGNLPDGHLRDAETLARVQGSLFMFFPETTVCNCSSVTFAARTSASSRIAQVSVAPVRSAPCKFAPIKAALVSVAPVRSAPCTFAPKKTALVSVAPVRSAPCKFVPAKAASVSVAPVRSAPCKFA